MRNMTSPVRNSNRRIFSLCAVFCILSVLTVFMAACDKKNDPTPTVTEQDLYGNAARPTWTVPEDYDYSSSMTAVIKVENLCGLIVKDSVVKNDDLLAAFVGEECRGVATYDDGLFFLYIAGPGDAVTLRYYSAHYTNLFVTEPIPFVNDHQLGSVSSPYKPAFVIATK